MLCQKDLQEDGWGGEGGTAGNIVGELGSIPTYPTFIPTGPKKLFCQNFETESIIDFLLNIVVLKLYIGTW